MSNTQGNFVFPLDDTYIHLAIAERIAHSANWGPSPFQFQFSSSSPAFSLILSAILPLFPKGEAPPLLLNALFGALFIWLSLQLSKDSFLKIQWRILVLFVVYLLIPLHLLLLLGMEHLAHLFFATLFLREASRKLAHPGTHPNGLLVIAAISMCLFRYEGLFLLAAYFLVGFALKRYKNVIFTSLFAVLPLLLIGVYMLANKGTFLPISVLGKASGAKLLDGALANWLVQAAQRFYENPFLLTLVLANLLLLLQHIREELRIYVLVFLIATGFHLLFAEVGGYRYEAYLMALGLLSFVQFKPSKLDLPLFSLFHKQIGIALVFLLLFPMILRSTFFTANYPLFCKNIYEQPIQAAKFLEKYYKKESVGMNDIGAGAYYGKVRLTDLVGIGDQKVFEYRNAGEYNEAAIKKLAKEREMRIAVIHDIWLEDWRPKNWIKVATWTIPDNLICADKTLSFYACQGSEVPYLRESLKEFARNSLPEEVEVLFVE